MLSLADTIIRLDDISVIRERRIILDGISLSVNRGDFLAITGPNGGGKTTLLRVMLKLISPSSGQVTYMSLGQPVNSLNLGYLPQKNMIDSRFPITVRQVIRSGLLGKHNPQQRSIIKPSNKHTDKAEQKRATDSVVNEMIAMMELEERADASIGNLSGGQLQRTLLGRALISKPSILVLDEPLSYVDKQFEHHIYDIIAGISANTTIILVSHEMSHIAAMANRHIIIDRTLTECTAKHHEFYTTCP